MLHASVKQYMTVVLTTVLVVAVGGSVAGGTMAEFFDTEYSKDNEFGAGTRDLEVSGGPVAIECGTPSGWYSEEFTLSNVGTLDALVTVHIPDLGYDTVKGVSVKGVKCTEAGTVPSGNPPQEYIYDGASRSYIVGSPIGIGVASSESEFVTEEGGYVGQVFVTGLGADAGSDAGPPDWVMSRFLDIRIYFDENGDGDFLDPGELVAQGTLSDIACNTYPLGVIPAPASVGDVVARGLIVEVNLQQVEDPAWTVGPIDYDGDGDIDADDAQLRWWPSNAFQGDRCTLDLAFTAIQP